MKMAITKLTLYSAKAFYPIHWEALKYLCNHYSIKTNVITDAPSDIPNVHKQLGWIEPQREAEELGVKVYYMPEGDLSLKIRWLKQQLKEIDPDIIWVQEEPTDYFLFQILKFYWFKTKPKIFTAVCENIFPRKSLPKQIIRQLLWGRLSGIMAVAMPSVEGIQAAGLPKSVATATLVAGNQSPPENLESFLLPFNRSPQDFIIGFAGRLCEEKGWKVLLEALKLLPDTFKCLMAGDGEQIEELKSRLSSPPLQGRVFYMGLLPKAELWKFYKNLDCLVVPSLTFPRWKEQFGGVIADGLAMGVPVIGSDSGAIPEVIGDAGLITPEGNVNALVKALEILYFDARLRERLSLEGKNRFNSEFSITAYANKIAQQLGLEPYCKE